MVWVKELGNNGFVFRQCDAFGTMGALMSDEMHKHVFFNYIILI